MIGPLVLVGLLSGGDCLSLGLEAARARRWDDAFRAFRAARARAGCDTPAVLFNLARAGEMRVEEGDDRLACEVAELYAELMETNPAPALARIAVEGRSNMARACARQAPETAPAPPTRSARRAGGRAAGRTLEWGLTTGAAVTAIGAGLTYVLATGRIEERDAAAQAFSDAEAVGDPVARADARLDFEKHRDAARALGHTSYALMGTAAVLTGLAIWAWSRDAAPTSGLVIGPGRIGWGGAF